MSLETADVLAMQEDFNAPTRVSLETLCRKYTVELPGSEHSVGELWDSAIRPLLLASGFSERAVDALVDGADE